MATDIVAGLRILRGIGGEHTFARNYADQSPADPPGRCGRRGLAGGRGVGQRAVLRVVPRRADLARRREVVAGRLTVGELISFFGYALFMVWPIQTFFELAQRWVRSSCRPGKASRCCPASRRGTPEQPLRLPEQGRAARRAVRVHRRAGPADHDRLGLPDDSAALADRLGRYLPADHDPVSLEVPDGLSGRRAKRALAGSRRSGPSWPSASAPGGEKWGVSLGSVDLADVPIAASGRRSWSATAPARCSRARCRRRSTRTAS
jgi:hypothetical protein